MLSDVVHDQIEELLKQLYEYDYADEQRTVIVDMISSMLLAVHRLDNDCNVRFQNGELVRGPPCRHTKRKFKQAAIELIEDFLAERENAE